MAHALLEELRDTIRSRFLVGLLVEECFEQLQPLLRSTVYHLYREFSRERTPRSPPLTPPPAHIDARLASSYNAADQTAQSGEVQLQKEGNSESQDKDKHVRTHPVPTITESEADMLCIIRSFKINIHCVASLAFGTMYNYSKDRYSVETENIELDSDDERPEPIPPTDGLSAGIRYSELNKQIMAIWNEYCRKNVNLLLNKILRILVQDRNIVYSDVITELLNDQCREIELDSNANEIHPVRGSKANVCSVGVNTDVFGNGKSSGPCSPQKEAKLRPDIIPVTNSQDFQQQTEPLQQHVQQLYHQQSPLLQHHNVPAGGGPVPEALVSHPVIHQRQPLNQMKQFYNPYTGTCDNHFQAMNQMQPMSDNNQSGIFFQRPTAPMSHHQQATGIVEEPPVAVKKRVYKHRNGNQVIAKLPTKKQASVVSRASPISPTPYMVPNPLLRERFRHHGNNINVSQVEQLQPSSVNPHIDSLQNMQLVVGANDPSKNMQLPPPHQHQLPYTDHQQQSMNQMQMTGGSQINNMPTMQPYAMGGYSTNMPNLGTAPGAAYSQSPTQMNSASTLRDGRMEMAHMQQIPGPVYPIPNNMRKRGFYDERGPLQAPKKPDNELSAGNMATNTVNPINQMGQANMFYGNNVPMQQDMNQVRMPNNWDAQMNYYSKNAAHAPGARLYDTYGRYQ